MSGDTGIQEYEQTGWEYSGSIGDFMHLIRWELVFQELADESSENLVGIIRDGAKVREYALSRGMTLRAVVNEMQIVAEATTEMLNEMEERKCDS